MTSRERKRLSAAERRARILAVAVRAFATVGYDDTSMEAIARRAKITKPVLYDHFPSKRALFQAVLEEIRDRLIARGKAIVKTGRDPARKFRGSVDAFLRFVEVDPDAARILLSVPRDGYAARASRRVQAGASAEIARLLAAFMPGSPPWQLQAATEFLKEGLHAVAKWWLENRDRSRGELVDVVARIAWTGLRRQAGKAETE